MMDRVIVRAARIGEHVVVWLRRVVDASFDLVEASVDLFIEVIDEFVTEEGAPDG